MFSHFCAALEAFQQENDSLAHDLVFSAFDAIALDLFYEYARQHQWSRASIQAASDTTAQQRQDRVWDMVRQTFELACGRHPYTITRAANTQFRFFHTKSHLMIHYLSMRYLHTMVRVHDIDAALNFYCTIMGLVETRRYESETGRFTNVFLAAPGDEANARRDNAPLLELTYNWPNEDGTTEMYTGGRNFGHLAYVVDNIYDYCAQVEAHGVTINRPPRDGRMAFFRSPEGISIEILQAGDPLPPAEPWQSRANSGTW
jgi:lactoylglutathione lyase